MKEREQLGTLQIIKRDGQLVDFDKEKIYNAMKKAYMSVYEEEIGKEKAEEQYIREGIEYIFKMIADVIEEEVITQTEEMDDWLSVEDIQDMVEESLLNIKSKNDLGLVPVVKAYLLYRKERTEKRTQPWKMTDLQRDIYESKYRNRGEDFEGFLDRVSGGNLPIKEAIRRKEFLPAGRILAGRGAAEEGRKVTLSNCYVNPRPEDNIESIYKTAAELARTYSYGGGVGINISNLRPRGSKVNNAARFTTGAVSFMDLFSQTTKIIGQEGRRGALMINMDVKHPDIEEFIDVKNDLEKVTGANISVNVSDEFMKAVENDEEFKLSFEVEATGEIIEKTIQAKEVFQKLAYNNWRMAEPGILYWDRIENWNIMSEDPEFKFSSVNPCAEEPLPEYGSCNLSSINLSNFVNNPFTEEAEFDYERFRRAVREGVKYLNEILDENMKQHPLKQQQETARDLRQIGLGIMGLADTFIKLGIRYGSPESIRLIHKIGKDMINSALQKSAELAKEEGPFLLYKKEAILDSPFLKENATEETYKMVEEYGLRNSQLLTAAPTGSIATMIGVSNGIEPIFQVSYTRKTESLHGYDSYYTVFTDIVRQYMDKNGLTKEEELPDFIVTSSDLDYRERIEVQSAWQQYIDASISSTVNVPNEFTVEQVEDLYMYAWKKGCKGITIYRDGCARSGILTTESSGQSRIQQLQEELNREIAKELSENPEQCPMCGGHMINSGGCAECQDCGYSPCAV